MEYSYVHGIKTVPQPGLVGICPLCGSEVVAKCGKIRLHHWAHKNLKDCDTWGEPETQWHRDWKNNFPMEYREVSFTNPITNEKHRADIHTAKGITIEFQNSPISIDELRSRDEFYKSLIWVVNGSSFRENFSLTCTIPNPASKLLDNYSISGIGKYIIIPGKRDKNGIGQDAIIPDIRRENLRFFRNPAHQFDFDAMDRALRIDELEGVSELMDKSQRIYWMFDWKRKRTAWFNSKSHVFFDFGDEFLYWLKKKLQQQGPSPLWYLHIVKKADFISKYSSL